MSGEKKISVLTPTYNDSGSMGETLSSLCTQTYENWEWIVINDGSTDDTQQTIEELLHQNGIGQKCTYIFQENADQLNAILNGLQYATGDYIFILHSDDLLPGDDFFQKCVDWMEINTEADGLFGDLILIDENSVDAGVQKIAEYHVKKGIPALMLLWLGRNLYSDVAFHRASVYKDIVKNNYLTWNMPLWIDLSETTVRMLNYISVPFPVLKYRVHSENYVNNELGRMNVINGELRTAVELMHHYSIPGYAFQYMLFRLMNKIIPGDGFPVIYMEKPETNPYKVISFIIKKRYPEGVENNAFLSGLLGFYKSVSERELYLPALGKVEVYYGKDVRSFNKKLLNGTLESFYVSFLEEMKKGFSKIIVQNEEDLKKIRDITKFLCLGHVEVSIQG